MDINLRRIKDNVFGRDLKNTTNDNAMLTENALKGISQTVKQRTEAQDEKLQTTLEVQSARIDNLILEGGGDSNLEVVDARTDEKGITHNIVGKRIEFSTIIDPGVMREVDKILGKELEHYGE
ncbi:hypothetical protein [Bacillus wiedmannii]|uniref:hypothetical protein n=1 Tax=Bacillus wiedmannii TaxID=1890302 RepID=UPI003F93C891